jgi:hypothetical protein
MVVLVNKSKVLPFCCFYVTVNYQVSKASFFSALPTSLQIIRTFYILLCLRPFKYQDFQTPLLFSFSYIPENTVIKISSNIPFKGIDRSFELRCEIRLNRLVMTNWRLGNFFYFILKGQHHKISKKPIDAA